MNILKKSTGRKQQFRFPMRVLFCLFLIAPIQLISQFSPAAGKPGSSALRYDSACFVAWATHSIVKPGYMDISNPDTGIASVGDTISATGAALQNGVVSLGDGGSVTLSFAQPIRNGIGWDFAVFENTFLDSFLELAFVSVSTDGKRFVRFPAESLTDTSVQTPAFGFTRPEKIHNLAGKYVAGYGTPFNLEELKDSTGIDIENINYVEITDVVGCMNVNYASRDSKGRKINDPWPTRFPSSGFDLDAVGVIHQNSSASITEIDQHRITFKPNPAIDFLNIVSQQNQWIKIYNIKGHCLSTYDLITGNNKLTLYLPNGSYFIRSEHNNKAQTLMISNQ